MKELFIEEYSGILSIGRIYQFFKFINFSNLSIFQIYQSFKLTVFFEFINFTHSAIVLFSVRSHAVTDTVLVKYIVNDQMAKKLVIMNVKDLTNQRTDRNVTSNHAFYGQA